VADTEVMERLETLVSPFGVVAAARVLNPSRGLDNVSGFLAYFGQPLPQLTADGPAEPRRADQPQPGGVAHGLAYGDPSKARLIAIAEAAERYSARDSRQPVVWAPQHELDGAVLDLDRIPRCSARELATPGCPLRCPDPAAPIRWIRGTDLGTGEPTWLPAVMAFYEIQDVTPAERFWYRISTGFAVHSDPAEALVHSICEVIERDSIAITWLQKLPLPVVAARCLSERARRVMDWARRHFMEIFLFDATTDMAVPTVFCLLIAPYAVRSAQLVSCATGRTIEAAAEKALLDGCATWELGNHGGEPPARFADFKSITDGARYMAMPGCAPAFDFLVTGAHRRPASERVALPEGSGDLLAWLIRSLSGKGMQAIAVDRTTTELAAAGLTAVNVVIPDLQPMSLRPLAQYRAHPRLYLAPARMGYRSLPEEELNPWPVPFA
jgi:ribosomal protein S12 methylthiotransferase accessory factor